MFNILLVNPSQKATYGRMKPPAQMHMGLAYLAAVLEKDNDVEILDIDADDVRASDFIRLIKNKSYRIAGFTVTTPTLSSSVQLVRLIKEHSPATLVVFGGIHPTIKPNETINLGCVDFVVRGEGELTFAELVKALKAKSSLSGVSGITYKKDGKIYETPPRNLIDNLDSLPFPARHLFKNKRYTYPDALSADTVPVITSRGCPGMCTYCNAHQIFTRAFRMRSARNVADEIEMLTKNVGAKEIHIWDDNFTTIRNRVFEIRDEILRRNIKVKFAFPNGIRADFLNKEILSALKEMGAYSIAIGVESGSQEVLKRARKGIKLDKVEETFRLARAARLETWAFFIIGLPGDTAATLKETIDFAKKINPDIAKFHILKPYPGTEVHDYLSSKNFILTEDYDRFGIHTAPIHRLEALEPSDMIEWQKRAYVSFYFRPAKIIEQMLRVRTFNRFLLNLQAGIGLLKMVLLKNE